MTTAIEQMKAMALAEAQRAYGSLSTVQALIDAEKEAYCLSAAICTALGIPEGDIPGGAPSPAPAPVPAPAATPAVVGRSEAIIALIRATGPMTVKEITASFGADPKTTAAVRTTIFSLHKTRGLLSLGADKRFSIAASGQDSNRESEIIALIRAQGPRSLLEIVGALGGDPATRAVVHEMHKVKGSLKLGFGRRYQVAKEKPEIAGGVIMNADGSARRKPERQTVLNGIILPETTPVAGEPVVPF